MKKILFFANLALIVVTCVFAGLYVVQNSLLFRILALTSVGLIMGVNIFSTIKFKENIKVLVFVSSGILLMILAEFMKREIPLFGLILFIISNILFLLALYITKGFRITDVIYSSCFFVAIMIMIIVFPNFGGILRWKGIVGIFYALSISAVIGKAVSNFVDKKDYFNSIVLSSLISLTLFSFFTLLLLYSSAPVGINYIRNGLYFIALAILAFSVFFNKAQYIVYAEVNYAKSKLNIKGLIAKAISIFLISSVSLSTFAFTMMQFDVFSTKVTKSEFVSAMGSDFELPIIEIKTQNYKLPDNKEDYVNCSFEISNCEDETQNFSIQMANKYGDENSVGIRLRGNSTRLVSKLPYRIKFDEKQSLFGLKKNKSWVLLADYYDQSYIRNYTAFAMADSFDNLAFSPTGHHVALVINGEFKGLYLLCEQMDENSGRADVKTDFDASVDTDFPFLVEMDLDALKEGVTGVDNFNIEGFIPVEIKYPEADERGATQDSDVVYDYIYEYMNAVFETLKTNQAVNVSFRNTPVVFEDLVNVDSAVDYYLVNEIMLNFDSFQKSIYFHKTKEGKLEFGPIWDFDYSMTTEEDLPYSKSHIDDADVLHLAKRSTIYQKLMANESFYNKVVERFNVKKVTILQTAEHLKTYKNSIEKIATFDAKIWHGTDGEFEFGSQYDYVRLFLLDRYDYLNDLFAKSHSEFLSVLWA